MDGTTFIGELKNGPDKEPRDNVFSTLWEEYEGVVMHSLVTSFGLDFLVHDQHGGDVDTIHNVRQIGSDPEMDYKNAQNRANYESRGTYDTAVYHSDKKFRDIKHNDRTAFDTNGTMLRDAYVPGNTLIPRHNKTISRDHQGQLDHVISAHEIHDDPGRVLSGLNGVDLANDPTNLRYTNADLNRNKGDKSIEEYIRWCEENPSKANQGGRKGKPLTKAVKQKMRSVDGKAREQYNTKIAREYYTSPGFMEDAAIAVKDRGIEMGLRQALGFVFAEIWMCTRKRLWLVPSDSGFEEMLKAVGHGIEDGMDSASRKYKEVIAKIREGFTAGALASLTTTLCNIFFTTAKNIVRYIRQVYASVVQAGKVLFLNPDNLMYGDRLRTTAVILASGASVLAGTATGDIIAKTPVGVTPEIGPVVTTFCQTMVSGLLSCTFLIFLDRSRFINELVDIMNKIPTIVTDYREIANAMESYAAKIANLDIEKFRQETQKYAGVAEDICDCEDEDSLNSVLYEAYKGFGVKIPWEGDFNTFMGNKNNRLVFG